MGVVYTIKYHPAVREDLSKLSQKMTLRIKRSIEEKLMTQPDLFGIPLRQSLKGHRKLRIGSYRIVYSIQKQVVFIVAVLPRDHVYEASQRRMSSS